MKHRVGRQVRGAPSSDCRILHLPCREVVDGAPCPAQVESIVHVVGLEGDALERRVAEERARAVQCSSCFRRAFALARAAAPVEPAPPTHLPPYLRQLLLTSERGAQDQLRILERRSRAAFERVMREVWPILAAKDRADREGPMPLILQRRPDYRERWAPFTRTMRLEVET